MRLLVTQQEAFAGTFIFGVIGSEGCQGRFLPGLPGLREFVKLFCTRELLRERFHELVMPEPSSPCKQIRPSACTFREGQGFAEPSADFRESEEPQAANWPAFFRTSF